jgi:hypothetical protein
MVNPRGRSMRSEAAVEVALDALIWLAARPEDLSRFAAETGADAASLRALAADPDGLGFVLDFLLRDEALLAEFAAAFGLQREAPAQARRALPGGDAPAWT